MFKWLKNRRESSKRRQKIHKAYLVPEDDFLLLRQIRLAAATGKQLDVVRLVSDKESNESWEFRNAKILHDFYGVNANDVLQLTGFWVMEKVTE